MGFGLVPFRKILFEADKCIFFADLLFTENKLIGNWINRASDDSEITKFLTTF